MSYTNLEASQALKAVGYMGTGATAQDSVPEMVWQRHVAWLSFGAEHEDWTPWWLVLPLSHDALDPQEKRRQRIAAPDHLTAILWLEEHAPCSIERVWRDYYDSAGVARPLYIAYLDSGKTISDPDLDALIAKVCEHMQHSAAQPAPVAEGVSE